MAEDEGNLTVIEVVEGQSGQRLDHIVSESSGMSRSQAQKLIKSGAVLLNGQPCRPKDSPKPGDKLQFVGASVLGPTFEAKYLPLNIVYEDDDVLVINKEAGIVVHPGAGTSNATTLIEAVAYYLQSKGAETLPGDELRPGVVHRLDKDTSGAMIVAKSLKALNSLSQQFKDKSNLREYVALVDGVMTEDVNEVETYLYRDPRHRTRYTSMSVESFEALDDSKKHGFKLAKSTFYHRRTFGNRLSLVQVRLSTGRTHQIRVHSKILKMPIVGDDTYGHPVQLPHDFPQEAKVALQGVKRQLLHAKKLGFTHPTTGKKLGFEIPLPEDFKNILETLTSLSR